MNRKHKYIAERMRWAKWGYLQTNPERCNPLSEDTDKASAPFWGFLAILVVMDIHRSKEEEETAELT